MTKKKGNNSKKDSKHEGSDFFLNKEENLAACVNNLTISQTNKERKRGRKKSIQNDSKSLANTYDIYNAYSQSVQNCSKEIQNLINLDKHLQHSLSQLDLPRFPKIFREDFCGTAELCSSWIDSHVSRFAYGLDISSDPVNYGIDRLKGSGKLDRVRLLVGNVLGFEYDQPPNYNNESNLEFEDFNHTLNNPEIELPSDDSEDEEEVKLELSHIPKADIICALNYALFFFQTRSDLVNYLTLCKNRLKTKGTLICDIFGGLHAVHPTTKLIKKLPDFNYYLKISDYNPLHQTIQLGLNFKFKDGSWNKSKFSYIFRVYSLREIIEAFKEAGFKTIEIWMASTPNPTNNNFTSDDEDFESENNEVISYDEIEGSDGDCDHDEDKEEEEEEEDPFKDYIQITQQTKQFPNNWNAYIVASPTQKFK